jgi:sugar lactone lactonase YvrE
MNTVPFRAALLSGLLLACGAAAFSQPLTFNTLAGYAGQGSADGLSSNARFSNPSGIAADSAGNVYVADTANHTIRQITPGGAVGTLAGLAGVSGSADGTGSAALFNQPQGVAVDSAGNVYVADTGNHTIRQIAPGGVVSTLAGLAGVSGSVNGTGGSARFYQPEGVAVDSGGNVYVADTWNHTIRAITPGGAVSTVAGLAGTNGSTDGTGGAARFYQPQGVAVDGAGILYVADTGNQTIRKIMAGGAVSTLAGLAGSYGSADGTGASAQFYGPAGVAVDGLGNVYVADYFNQTLRKVTAAGVVTTLAGSPGNFGSADGANSTVRFWNPAGVAVTGTGSLTVYVADSGNGTIRALTLAGANWVSSTPAGSASTGSADLSGSAARFYWPGAAAVDGAGNVYVADTQNGTVRKATADGVVSTLAGLAGNYGSADGTGGNARFYGPQGIAVDATGTAYVADTVNATIRKVTAGGVATTFAGSAGNPGVADGTGSAARFNEPQGLAVDGAGTVYVADTWNHTVRKITAAGVVSTLAGVPGSPGSIDGTGSNTGTNKARFNCPAAVAVDLAKNVYVADYFNHTVRKITPAGVVSTLAGLPGVWGSADGTGSAARFYEPAGIAVDSGGSVYVLDSGNHTMRKLTPVGTNWVVSTVAGLADISGSSDGLGSIARFSYPVGLAVNSSGLFYVADTGNSTLRQGSFVVGGAPAIVAQPQGQTANPGSSVTFTVTAVGLAPLAYQWRFNLTAISGATASSYTRANVQQADGGNYSVVVTNVLGSAASASALLSINGPPLITGQPQPQFVLPGQSATFSVIASGTAPLRYQWQFNGSGLPGATGQSFTLAAAQFTNQGLYSVVVTNAQGVAVSASAQLGIIGLQAWGDNTWNQLSFSAQAYDLIAIAAGAWHSLGLRADGVVLAWGDDSNGQCDVPATLPAALAIAGGGYHSLALLADGTVAAWGADDYGQTDVPASLASVIGISAGTWHNLALRRDGTVVAWGDNSWGQTNVPVGLSNVVAVAAGGNHSLALQASGTVVAWGENTDAGGNPVGQSVVPGNLGSVVAIAAGDYHSLAVQADGTVAAWGDDSQGQSDVPLGLTNVVSVSGGGAHSLALTADGTVVAWGANWNGQSGPPPGLSDVVGIGAGEAHSLALPAGSLPVPQLLGAARQGSRFSVLVQTLYRQSYALEFKNSLTATNWSAVATNAGNGALLQLIDPAATTPQRYYRMREW